MITIYGLDGCQACVQAVKLCQDMGQKYQYFLATPEKVEEFTEDTIAPFILIDGQYVGSINHLQWYFADVSDRLEAIKTYLQEDVYIEFLKVDGTSRTMHCTQNMNRIPVEHHPKQLEANEATAKVADKFLLKVFDIEANGWRSIRGERIIRYS